MKPHHAVIPSGLDGLAAAQYCLALPEPPGSPEDIRAVARDLARTAQVLRGCLADVRSVGQDASAWSGQAARAFHEKLTEPSKSHLDELPARYEGYGQSLLRYASELEDTKTAVWRAREALHRAVAARPASPPHGSGPDEECRSAATHMCQAWNGWVGAVIRCIDQLHTIDEHDHLHNPHGWHAAVGVIATAMGDISTITALLGLVALAVFPPAAAVLFAVSAGTGTVGLAADAQRKFQYHDEVGWTDLAVDALSVVPVGAVGREARAGFRAGSRVAPRLSGAAVGAARGLVHGNAFTYRAAASPASAAAITASRGIQNLTLDPLAAAANNAWHQHGAGESWRRALSRAPVRVAWQPIKDLRAAGHALTRPHGPVLR